MSDTDEKIEKIRKLIELLRENAHEGHMPYVVDTLDLMADVLSEFRVTQ